MTEMRRLAFVAVGLLVLVTAGFAVAKGLEPTKSITSITGTFAAATVQPIGKATSCTTSDGKTLVTAKARYSGVAAGDGNLAGAITLDARIVANATDNIGVVDGKLRIHLASGGETVAQFTGVWASGKLVGFATGHTQDPHAKLFANFSSGFAPATGFTGGKIGATDGGSAVEVGPGKCAPKHDQASKGEKGHDSKKDDNEKKDDDN
jgi:hypothetical protein